MTRQDELAYIIPSLSKELGGYLCKVKGEDLDSDFFCINLVSDTIDEIRQYLIELGNINATVEKVISSI
jgi:hypothetical protein